MQQNIKHASRVKILDINVFVIIFSLIKRELFRRNGLGLCEYFHLNRSPG